MIVIGLFRLQGIIGQKIILDKLGQLIRIYNTKIVLNNLKLLTCTTYLFNPRI